MKTLLALTLLLGVSAPALAQETETATAKFENMKGEDNGLAKLTATPAGVLIDIEVSGLPSGQWLGFHIHETGECDAASHHESAGGHFNPTDKEHGYMSATGPHAGDMPNVYVPADGIVRAQVLNNQVKLDESETGIVGRALMIHGGTDDYKTQPTGDAGDRYACAVIEAN